MHRTEPLNGAKTHPLSKKALADLEWIATKPRPAQEINPGVHDRLDRGGLIERIELESPYATHKGRKIAFVQITQAGRNALAASKEA